MPREKGSKNKSTLAREAQLRAEIIAQYEASRKPDPAPAPVAPAKEPAKTIEEHEELNLDPTEGIVQPETVIGDPISAVSSVLSAPAIEDDLPLDLDPPVNPIKSKRLPSSPGQAQNPKKPVDKRQPAKVDSGRAFVAKPAPRLAASGMGAIPKWRRGSKGA